MAKKLTFYRIDFDDCISPEYDFTIVWDMKEARQYLEDVLEMDENSSVKIYPVKMTEKQYEKFIEQCERNA
jgi:hypothetical protein